MEKVRVDRSVLVGLATLAGVSLLAVAFLLGRSSGPGAPPAPAPSAASPRPPEAAPPGPAPRVDAARLPQPDLEPGTPPPPGWPAEAPRPPVPGPGTPPSPAAPDPAPPTAGPVPAAGVPGAAAVAAYFSALDAIQPSSLGGDPQSLAGSLATALAQGDASGVDGLIRETEDARARLLAVAPPAACATHHRETLASVEDALEMLRALKTAVSSPDPASALADVAARSAALKSRAETLQAEERTLRERYGLAR